MKSLKTSITIILKTAMFSLFYLFIFSLQSIFAAPGIKITSPQDGAVVHPDEEVAVTVEAVDGFVLKEGLLLLPTKEDYDEDLVILPATRNFRVPKAAVGAMGILAIGENMTGEKVDDHINIMVQQTAVLQSLSVRPKTIVFHLDWNGGLDKTWNDYEYLGVDGLFSDGVKRNLTGQGVVFSSTDSSVISIDGEGKAIAHKSGEAKIIVSYSGVTKEVPVVFGKPIGLPRNETIPPTSSIDIKPTANTSGWHNTDVTVTLTARDNEGGSGMHSIYYEFSNIGKEHQIKGDTAVVTLTDEGRCSLYYHAQDKDINEETSSHETPFSIDKTSPEISITTPTKEAEYIVNSPIIASWSATDGLSGINSAIGTVPSGSAIDTSKAGSGTFRVIVTDNAGNKTEVIRTYHVRYSYGGVLAPINQDGSSIFKLDRVIPVKFQLKDASGNYISTAVAKIYLSKISNEVAGAEVEAESPGEANTGNLFRYNATDNQYIFNLGTSNLSQGTWQIRIELNDGSSKFINVSVR